ncbi:unnamed protein product, partial [Rotaria sp. Silwood2]
NEDLMDVHEREILELHSRLNKLMVSYDETISNNSVLQFEMDTYRRLLKSEKTHVKKMNNAPATSLASNTTTIPPRRRTDLPSPSVKPLPSTHIDTKTDQTQMQAKTTFQRSAKGPININECSPDGKYIKLANTSKNKDIDLTGWRLLRKVDNSPEITYSIPSGFKLASGKYVNIHARGQAKERSPYDLILDVHESWGIGVSVITRLLNEQNKEVATHIQKTGYAA